MLIEQIVKDTICSKYHNIVVFDAVVKVLSLCGRFIAHTALEWAIKSVLQLLRSVYFGQGLVRVWAKDHVSRVSVVESAHIHPGALIWLKLSENYSGTAFNFLFLELFHSIEKHLFKIQGAIRIEKLANLVAKELGALA